MVILYVLSYIRDQWARNRKEDIANGLRIAGQQETRYNLTLIRESASKNGIYFCSARPISPHIGICHFEKASCYYL